MESKQQIINLQESVSYLEITVDQLNEMIAKQDKELQDLKRQMQLMYNYLNANASDDGIAPFDLMADRPPHY